MKERTLCPIPVGRESELTALEDALIDAARGRFVVIAGDAGMGKTRLTSAAQGCAAKLGFTTLRGGCAPMDVAIPYLPLLEAAGNGLARSDLARVRTWVGPAAAELGGLFPQLEGDPEPQARNAGGDGTLRLFESVVMLLSALGEGGPVLFIIEDLQWSDPATRDLVDYLARRAPSLPLLVLATPLDISLPPAPDDSGVPPVLSQGVDRDGEAFDTCDTFLPGRNHDVRGRRVPMSAASAWRSFASS